MQAVYEKLFVCVATNWLDEKSRCYQSIMSYLLFLTISLAERDSAVLVVS